MDYILKNVLPDTELPRIRKLFRGSVAKHRGPRVGRVQANTIPIDLAVKSTMYWREPWAEKNRLVRAVYGDRYWENPNYLELPGSVWRQQVYAITGWKGDKPIVRPLDDANDNPSQPYYLRRKSC